MTIPDDEKWEQIMEDYTPDEVLEALGVAQVAELPDELPAILEQAIRDELKDDGK